MTRPSLSHDLLEAGAAILKRDNRAEARQVFEMALAEARESGDRRDEVNALLELAKLSENGYDPDGGRRAAAECLALCEEHGLPAEAGAAYGSLGLIAFSLGDLDEAIRQQERSLAAFQAAGSRLGQALALARLGRAYQEKEEFQAARPYLENALALFEDLGELHATGQILWNLGYGADLGDHDLTQSRACYAEALARLEAAGTADEVRLLRGNLAVVDRCLQAQAGSPHFVIRSEVALSGCAPAVLEVLDPAGRPLADAFLLALDETGNTAEVEVRRPGRLRLSLRSASEPADDLPIQTGPSLLHAWLSASAR